jgi:integrase
VLFDPHVWVLCKSKEGLENPAENDIKMKRYLLCLIAACTGLRAGEVFMLKKSNIEKIGGIYFLNIDNSRVDLQNPGVKTENAYRRVPITNFVYKAINNYIAFANITGDYLFFSEKQKTQNGRVFIEAYKECGIHCGFTEEEIKESNVDFHSFRHFFRTICEQNGLPKNLVRAVMGHSKNMQDMSDRYSHIEEIGNDLGDVELLLDNAKKVIDVLEKHFNDAYLRHNDENEKQVVYIEPKEVEITNQRKVKIKYWTYAVVGYENFIDIAEE